MSGDALKLLLNDVGRQTQARGYLRGLLDAEPTTLNYMKWYNELPFSQNKRNIAIVSSFTTETIAPFLGLEAFLSGWRISPKFYQYSEWWTVIADPRKLENPKPEACVLLLHSNAVLAQDTERDTDSIKWIESLVNNFRRESSIPLFVGLLLENSTQHAVALGDSLSHGRPRSIARIQNIIIDLAIELEDVHVLDIATWQIYAKSDLLDIRGYLNNLSPLNGLGMSVLARGIARCVGCLFQSRRKVLVVDLDNTLWGGVLGEDGFDGIELGHEWPGLAFLSFQDTIQSLNQSGILLAICSKNEENDVRKVFDQKMGDKLSWDNFVAYRINWNNKAENLISIGEELGLGLDTFVFIDDSPKECALVREMLPMVEVVELAGNPETFSEQLLACRAFDTLGLTKEDSIRSESYQRGIQRKNYEKMSASLEDFYSSMKLHIKIYKMNENNLSRAHELLNKTNQFNMVLDRPTLQQLRERESDDRKIYCVELMDRFGEHGIIAILELRKFNHAMHISNLAVSCRALGCLVEDTVLAFGGDQSSRQGATTLIADYVIGPRNMQVEQFLLRMGFRLSDENKCQKQFVRSLTKKPIKMPEHVTLQIV